MINSMFSLDHRLAELRPSENDLRAARQVRDAAASTDRAGKASGAGSVRNAYTIDRYAGQASRLAAF